MTTTSDPRQDPSRQDPFSELVDYDTPWPNILGKAFFEIPDQTPFQDDPDLIPILTTLWERGRAHNNLRQFAQTYLDVIPAAHHRLMCDAVDSMIVNNAFDVLVIMSPPASAKSTYISVAAPAYIIGRDPSLRIISVSRAADLATQFGSRVKNIVGSDEFRLATGIELSQDTRAKDNWKTTDGGGYVAVGAGGGVLGLRADVVLCDDIHASFEDAQSETQLQKIRTWFESDLLSRLTPTGKLIIVGQRLNANDIIGYVLQRAAENPGIRLRTLKFTAECDTDTALGDEPDLLGRAKGERMWPEFYTDEYLADKKRDDYIWRTLWMQEPPSDTGSWVAPDELIFYPADPADPAASPAPPPSLIYYLCSDLALSVNSGDYSVHIVCGMDDTRTMHVVHAWRDRCDVNATADKMIALTLQYHPVECLIDDDNASKVFVQLLASKCREQGVPVPWKALPMRGQDKETRASPLRGAFKRRKVVFHRGEWTRWLFKELLMFPNAMGQGVDDGVDALGLMGRRMASLAAAAPPLAPVIPMKTIQQATLAELWEDKERGSRHSRRI